MTLKRLQRFLCGLTFFHTLKDEDWRMLMQSEDVFLCTHRSNEGMKPPVQAGNALSILLSGTATVHNASKGGACLKQLTQGAVYGAASLFCEKEEPLSTIYAKSTCEVCYLGAPLIQSWLESNSEFAFAYIRFLSERVRFLNERITAFTASGAQDRLRNHLYTLCDGVFPCVLNVNAVRMAKMLNIGRASLYRAFSALEESGHIQKNGKSITVLHL